MSNFPPSKEPKTQSAQTKLCLPVGESGVGGLATFGLFIEMSVPNPSLCSGGGIHASTHVWCLPSSDRCRIRERRLSSSGGVGAIIGPRRCSLAVMDSDRRRIRYGPAISFSPAITEATESRREDGPELCREEAAAAATVGSACRSCVVDMLRCNVLDSDLLRPLSPAAAASSLADAWWSWWDATEPWLGRRSALLLASLTSESER
jgi:hypothetical protein